MDTAPRAPLAIAMLGKQTRLSRGRGFFLFSLVHLIVLLFGSSLCLMRLHNLNRTPLFIPSWSFIQHTMAEWFRGHTLHALAALGKWTHARRNGTPNAHPTSVLPPKHDPTQQDKDEGSNPPEGMLKTV
ncbi:hypothetical protein FB451DRAFT_1409206 [Mycena latifolia]|nr:hypothetical protein FB451DRAFT_1409206 [Mycena latifolia]